MIDPKEPTQAGLDRFRSVVRHLGAVNMTPSVADAAWPRVDAQSVDLTKELVAAAITLRKRPARPVATQHQTAEKKP